MSRPETKRGSGCSKVAAGDDDSPSELVSSSLFMDNRLPYDMERVVSALISMMITKGLLSVNEAKRIMASGESYLH
ncbi:MAG TPA: hypothetical protein VNI77_07385 [Nitrososphaera sp.]|nr:hypothetical protein [Nitrososphaera sp.]